MSNQELLDLICLERVNEGGGSKCYSYNILTPPPNSVTENTSVGSFISVVKSIQLRYHLIVISLSINLDMLRTGQ